MSTDQAKVEKFLNQRWHARPIVNGEVCANSEGQPIKGHQRVLGDLFIATPAECQQAISAAAKGWGAWNELGVSARIELIQRYDELLMKHQDELAVLYHSLTGRSLEESQQEVVKAQAMLRFQQACAAELLEGELPMPGPTGESNTLYSAGRGVYLCLSSADTSLAALTGQLTAALVAGNTVLMVSEVELALFTNRLVELALAAGLPRAAIHHLPAVESIEPMLDNAQLAGIAIAGTLAKAQELNRQLATRTAQIAQLVVESDGQGLPVIGSPDYLLRFITERTRTINTTAVGGNATLLELGSSHH